VSIRDVMQNFRGVWSPMPTPLDRSGEIDEETTRRLVDRLLEGGVDGLFPMGTTGEFALFTREERKRMVRIVVEQAGGRAPVLAGISDPAPENVLLYAKDAEEAGADALIATPPYYYSVTDDGILEHYESIHAKTKSPLFVYDIPEWTHNFVTPAVVEKLVDKGVIQGMKYTEYNMLNLLSFLSIVGKRIPVFTGSDAMLSTCIEFGGAGGVVSVCNLFPKATSSIYDLAKSGKQEDARDLQLKLLPAIEAAGVGKFPAGLKEGMRLVGFPVGNVRPPLLPVSTEDREKIRSLIADSKAKLE
jgi:4-hydroxy-tetrahydrodipicolinate synthase